MITKLQNWQKWKEEIFVILCGIFKGTDKLGNVQEAELARIQSCIEMKINL